MIKKALVLGYFGFENNQLDGQTVKTRNIYDLLKSKTNIAFEEVNYFDTQSFQKNKLNIFKSFGRVIKSDIIYYLPAQNNLRLIFPFIFILCKIFNVQIHYIVVGGWLGDFIHKKPLHRSMLSRVKGIYPQVNDLTSKLKLDYNFENVFQLQNFRITDFSSSPQPARQEIKLVFMARIHPTKGVETVFELEKQIIEQNISNISIDLYGPIYEPFERKFNKLLSQSKLIRYKGILEPKEIYKRLEQYDLMLFPTQFFTEGFPGTILDAYIAEVPVIATKWKYATEFIENNVSGVIVKFDDSNEFINSTINLIQDIPKLNKLKKGTQKLKDKFSPEAAWIILQSKINRN